MSGIRFTDLNVSSMVDEATGILCDRLSAEDKLTSTGIRFSSFEYEENTIPSVIIYTSDSRAYTTSAVAIINQLETMVKRARNGTLEGLEIEERDNGVIVFRPHVYLEISERRGARGKYLVLS